jgi:hypothetical protein
MILNSMAEVGRPTVMTESVIAKLEDAFSNGATDLQACFLANISKDSLYRYIQEHPSFSDRKQGLKDMIAYQAKVKIKDAIRTETIPFTAKWYLERKDNEFKPKSDITTDNKPLPLLGGQSNGISTNTSNEETTIPNQEN